MHGSWCASPIGKGRNAAEPNSLLSSVCMYVHMCVCVCLCLCLRLCLCVYGMCSGNLETWASANLTLQKASLLKIGGGHPSFGKCLGQTKWIFP